MSTARLVAAVAMAAIVGCAAGGPKGEIPLGQWTGQGTFVYEYWQPGGTGAKAVKPQSIHRSYPTRLTIRPGRLDDREVIELLIHSDRGPLPDLGEKTHLEAALVKAKQVSDTTTLYRVVGFLFNPKPGEELRFDASAPPFGASCATVDGSTVLQIQYADNFVDTLRFGGRQVEKSGMAFNLEEGMVHWSEHLIRKDPGIARKRSCQDPDGSAQSPSDRVIRPNQTTGARQGPPQMLLDPPSHE